MARYDLRLFSGQVPVPTVAIVNFRGDKLYDEHIYWDQASVLVEIGLLDPTALPVVGIDAKSSSTRHAPQTR
jgi:hypothetical protein